MILDGRYFEGPNMASLEGEMGVRIYETIRDTPKVNWAPIDKRCEEIEERIVAARQAGK